MAMVEKTQNKQSNTQDRERIVARFIAKFQAWIPQRLEQAQKEIAKKLKLRDPARPLLSMMNQQKKLGLWEGKANSTYELALKASESYRKAEKARTDYLAMAKIYEDWGNRYLEDEAKLAQNLFAKLLEPWSDNIFDPLIWYIPVERLIRLCGENGVELKPATVRKYRRLGLLSPPVYFGHEGYYSYLDVLIILIIDNAKKEGCHLSELREGLNASIKATLVEYSKKPYNRRTWFEKLCVAVGNLIDPHLERLAPEIQELQDPIQIDRIKLQKGT